MNKLLHLVPVLTVFLADPLSCRPEAKIPPVEQGTVISVKPDPGNTRDFITISWPDGKTTSSRVDPGECPLQSEYPKCAGEG